MIKYILTDPRLFNCILMILNLFSAVRWGFYGRWWNVLYWLAAFLITFAVTFGRLGK